MSLPEARPNHNREIRNGHRRLLATFLELMAEAVAAARGWTPRAWPPPWPFCGRA